MESNPLRNAPLPLAGVVRGLAIGWLVAISVASAAPADDGFLRVPGPQIELITDLPETESLKQLPLVFDRAVPLWGDYFGIPLERLQAWRMRGFVVRSEDRFRQAGYWPADLPPFLHGFQRGDALWVREQPSDYYLRHLWLHEGTHGVMLQFLGTTGPPWLAEGLAEYLATHLWQNDQLKLAVMPASKQDVPYWGRIKLLREEASAQRVLSIDEVVSLDGEAFQEVRGYAWSWALVALLDQHPDWRPIFHRRLKTLRPGRPGWQALWTRQLLDELRAVARSSGADSPVTLEESWRLLIDQLDYGYDIADESVVTKPARIPGESQDTVVVDSRLGWQSSGWHVKKGERYRLSATGRYRVKRGERPWMSEAGGVTIVYNQGLPLGMLLATVRGTLGEDPTSLARATPVGLEAEWTPDHDGVVYLRINERAGSRRDNEGQLRVTLSRPETLETGTPTANGRKPD